MEIDGFAHLQTTTDSLINNLCKLTVVIARDSRVFSLWYKLKDFLHLFWLCMTVTREPNQL